MEKDKFEKALFEIQEGKILPFPKEAISQHSSAAEQVYGTYYGDDLHEKPHFKCHSGHKIELNDENPQVHYKCNTKKHVWRITAKLAKKYYLLARNVEEVVRILDRNNITEYNAVERVDSDFDSVLY